MEKEAYIRIIESQQELIYELVEIIKELSKDKEREVVIVPSNDSEDDTRDLPWGPWRPYPYDKPPWGTGGPWVGTDINTKVSFKVEGVSGVAEALSAWLSENDN